MKRISLNIGDIAVSREPVIMETILGSCVAVCLWDTSHHIGGLNHYLVPTGRGAAEQPNLYGINSVRSLIEQTLRVGADIRSLQARIFGGGSIMKSLEDIFTIGAANVQIAREILAEYGIPVIQDFVGAECGIRISFKTSNGAVAVTCFDQESGRRYQDYFQHLADSKRELAFNSTHAAGFFKEAQQFHYLEDEAIPDLARRKRYLKELRIWCAGCTTGEAAYSLAISFWETLAAMPPLGDPAEPFGGWDTRILATDTSVKALATATAATYGIEQLPERLPDSVKSRFFLKGSGVHAGHIRIKPCLRETIRFRQLNLKAPDYPFKKQFDLIFCHDGLRALDDTARQDVLQRLQRQLAPAGYLILGQRMQLPDSMPFEQVAPAIYRKV